MAHALTFIENRTKIIVAFAFAPVVPSILDGSYLIYTEGDFKQLDMRPVAWFLIGAYLIVFLLGIPCYKILRLVLAPSALNCVLLGALIAGIPWTLFFSGDWNGLIYFSKFTFIPGALGGLIFWAIATSGQKVPWY